MKFDTALHKFGMAYKHPECQCGKDHIIYPKFHYRSWDGTLIVDGSHLASSLTRAPEHDLIHRAVFEEQLRERDEEWKQRADKLVEALEFYANAWVVSVISSGNDGVGRILMADKGNRAIEARAEYKKAIGE